MDTNDGLATILDLAQAVLDDATTSAEQLAARAHLSRFHFDRVVASIAGEPPGSLRRRLLLERSAHRLVAPTRAGQTILDVAIEAGYSSHEAYTRAFARAYGRPPTAVRRAPPLTFRELELPGASGVPTTARSWPPRPPTKPWARPSSTPPANRRPRTRLGA